MRFGPPSPEELGRYFALSQIGLEMVAPIGLELALDYWLGSSPWGAVIGAILGFVGGIRTFYKRISGFGFWCSICLPLVWRWCCSCRASAGQRFVNPRKRWRQVLLNTSWTPRLGSFLTVSD